MLAAKTSKKASSYPRNMKKYGHTNLDWSGQPQWKFFETSQTKDYTRSIENKSHSSRFTYIHAYSDILSHIQNPVQPWYTQNTRIFGTKDTFRTLVYWEAWHIQNPDKHLRWTVLRRYLTTAIVFTNYNYWRNISLPRSLWNKYEFLNLGLIFILEVLILCKEVWEAMGMGVRGGWILIYLV